MTAAVQRESSRRASVAAIDATLVLRFGLAVLFAANALVAWIDPDDFTSLVEDSGVGRLIDSQVVLWGIRVNDFLAALAVLFVWNRAGLDRPLPGRRGCDQARRDGLVAGDEEEPG
jgi:hypothetical protein